MSDTQVSDVVVPSGDTSGTHPRHQGANGTGGAAGTHEGHANAVPLGLFSQDGVNGGAPPATSDMGDQGGNVGIL